MIFYMKLSFHGFQGLKLIEKETIINGWKPLRIGLKKKNLEVSNVTNINEQELEDDDNIFKDLLNELEYAESSSDEEEISVFKAEML